MSASADQVARLRRMVAEPTEDTYLNSELETIIELFPLIDSDGREPTHDDWEANYDLNRAAAEVWGEKAAALASHYDFGADGATYQRSQAYEQAQKQTRQYMSRSAAVGTPLRTTFEEIPEWPQA